MTNEEFIKEVKFDENGLVAVIAQDYHSKHVRMLAYMNEEALIKTLETNNVYYYSRSRNELWLKGETSGYYQHLKGISIDCDGDALLIQIEQVGGISCHTGNTSCFYRELGIEKGNNTINMIEVGDYLGKLESIVNDRKENPKEGSYTNYLFSKGIDKILKKIGEETTEVIIASKTDKKEDIVYEVTDLVYHLTVLLVSKKISWKEIGEELEKR